MRCSTPSTNDKEKISQVKAYQTQVQQALNQKSKYYELSRLKQKYENEIKVTIPEQQKLEHRFNMLTKISGL